MVSLRESYALYDTIAAGIEVSDRGSRRLWQWRPRDDSELLLRRRTRVQITAAAASAPKTGSRRPVRQ